VLLLEALADDLDLTGIQPHALAAGTDVDHGVMKLRFLERRVAAGALHRRLSLLRLCALGVGTANVIYLPVAYKLKALSGEEAELRTLTVEGILAIQAGDNPRVVEDKLLAFLSPEQRADEEPEPPSGAKPDLAEAA
jgi:hypothetical protein